MSDYHIPVLLEESVGGLVLNPDGVYADATFGGGGHSRAILARLSSQGRLISFDLDSDAASQAPSDPRFTLVRNNFRFIHNYTRMLAPEGLDGILADLGVSSHQFDTAERGFSFRFDAPLDMRMNASNEKTAADIVNSCTQEELERIFRNYGEVDGARQLARQIVVARETAPILTTTGLSAVIATAMPQFQAHKQTPKVFQALRIEVNGEMRSLEKFLTGAARSLKPGGILAVITYHSLEDRMVKQFMREPSGGLSPVNRKPILPSDEEVATNPRARSAKLRIAKKTGEKSWEN